MEGVLRSYLEKCQLIFHEHRSNAAKNLLVFPGASSPKTDYQQFFEGAIKDAEESEEFEAFVLALQAGPLSLDIERLARARAEARKESPVKFQDFIHLKRDTARYAAKGFFRNTGAYVNLWQDSEVDGAPLLRILENYTGNDSELIRLFVFDGFVLYDDKKPLNHVNLPIGVLKKYPEKELEDLLRVPQSVWHGKVNPEMMRTAATSYILPVAKKEDYRGVSGIWLDGMIITPTDWEDVGEQTKKESDIGIIGPIFLCIGEDTNLAVEIRVRTNVFEHSPIREIVRNGYLPWDEYQYDNEGEPCKPRPRTSIIRIGEAGNKLRTVWEIWHEINDLDTHGHLTYPTETYVRSVMNVASLERFMETFVGFVTLIESLLTPDPQQELTYKMAIRGASLLDSDPQDRLELFDLLKDFYNTRSKIVHEGRTGKDDSYGINDAIPNNLIKVSRQIFLRYICVLHLALHGGLPGWVVPDLKKLSSKGRPKALAQILDSLVLAPDLTKLLEENMQQWGVYEDWKGRTRFRLSKKHP